MDETRDQTHHQSSYPIPLGFPSENSSTFEAVDFWASVKLALTDEEFEIIEMRYQLNMTQEEIAEKVGISQQAVWKRLDKIFKKLREWL